MKEIKKHLKALLISLIGIFMLPNVVNAQVTINDSQANTIKDSMGYYAFYDDTVNTIKARMSYDIFGKVVHEYSESQVGYTAENSDYTDVLNNINFGTKQTGSGNGISSLSYYEYTYQINSNVSKTGKVYVLPNKTDFIVASIENNTIADYTITNANDTYKYFVYDGEEAIVFGNSVVSIASYNEINNSKVNSSMYENSRSDFELLNLDETYRISAVIATIKNDTKGIFINRSYSKDTRGWGLTEFPMAVFNDTTIGTTYEMNLYFGIQSIGYTNLSDSNTIKYLNSNTNLNLGSYNNISIADDTPSNAVTINKENKEITFNSSYYSDVTFKVDDGYLNINRIAINYEMCNYPDATDTNCAITDSLGNDPHPVTYITGSTGQLYAQYFYPIGATNERVSLFVTYTYSDGTVKTKVISPYDNITPESNTMVGFDVYEIFAGTKETFPETVEAIAFYGSLDSATFEGSSFGKGNGVKITKSEMRFDR